MAARHLAAALDARGLSVECKLLLLVLADAADGDGRVIELPSTLRSRACLPDSHAAFVETLGKLVALGWVDKDVVWSGDNSHDAESARDAVCLDLCEVVHMLSADLCNPDGIADELEAAE